MEPSNTCPLCMAYQPVSEIFDVPEDRYCKRHRLTIYGPRATGKRSEYVDLTGCMFAWRNESPLTCEMPGSDLAYLACFRRHEDLVRFMHSIKVPSYTVKVIVHGGEFLDCVPREVRVILDPRQTEEGTLRYTEITLQSS